MRTQKISFPDRHTLCVFPQERSDLSQAATKLNLEGSYPVIVLIGGEIDEHQAVATQKAIQTIARVTEDLHAVIICGGTDMGIMAKIGQIRLQNQYKFPLVGVAPEELVAWPGGLRNTKFLWWGKKRWDLESHYSHFILVPGNQFGDESPWIIDAATILSRGHQSVTILINGGSISRKDVELSLEKGRQVIALNHTGRLADEYSRDFNKSNLIRIVSATDEQRMVEVIRAALTIPEESIQQPITL